MAITYSNLKLAEIASGTEDGTWGLITNGNITVALEEAIVGRAEANFPADSNYTLPWTDTYATQVARNYVLNVTGSLSGTRDLIVPAIEKPYLVQNNTTGGQSIRVKTAAGNGVTIPNGKSALVYTDATHVVAAFDYVPDLTADTLTLTTALPVSSGGTGATTLASGGILRGNGTGPISVASAADISAALGSTSVSTATNLAGGGANRIAYNTGAGTTGFINAPTTASTYLQWDGASFDWSSVSAGGVVTVTASAPLASSGGSSPNISFTGTLPLANGGTNASDAATARSNLDVPSTTGSGASGTWSISINGSAASATTAASATSATTATTATNIAGGAANQIHYQTGSGSTSFITAPSVASTFLQWNGSAFTWAAAAGSGVTSITGTSNQVIASASTGAVTLSLPQSIGTSSNVQFGTITATSQIYSYGNVTAYYSDDRLKTRLGNIQSALEKILQLETFYYEANETAQALGYEKVREVGLSAQQVQSVLPEVVKPAPVDPQYLTVQYERLVPLLVQAVKELAGLIPGGSSANPGIKRTEG